MSDHGNNYPVLGRMGAHQLTEDELDKVAGGSLTLASELATGPINNPDSVLDT